MFTDCEVISSYSRADAIADGVLVDVTETAREAGIKYPTAITRAAWETVVAVPEGVAGQDEAGRLWDVLWMWVNAVRGRIPARYVDESTLLYKLHVRNDNRFSEAPLVELKAVCGPGDDFAPVITISLPEED